MSIGFATQEDVDYWTNRALKAETELDRLRAELAELAAKNFQHQAEVSHLRELLREYGGHKVGCVGDFGLECSCGWRNGRALLASTAPKTEDRGMSEPTGPFERIIRAFDRNATAQQFLSEDGEGGFSAGVIRMAEEIDRLRAENERLRDGLESTAVAAGGAAVLLKQWCPDEASSVNQKVRQARALLASTAPKTEETCQQQD